MSTCTSSNVKAAVTSAPQRAQLARSAALVHLQLPEGLIELAGAIRLPTHRAQRWVGLVVGIAQQGLTAYGAVERIELS